MNEMREALWREREAIPLGPCLNLSRLFSSSRTETVDVFIELAPAYPDRPPLLKYRYASKQFPLPPAASSSASKPPSSSSSSSAPSSSSSAINAEEKGGVVKTEPMAAELPPLLEAANKKLLVWEA